MDAAQFRQSPTGRLAPTIDGQFAFVPHPLPPDLDLSPIIRELDEASRKLGELNGIGTTLINPYLLIRPLQRREAVASSNIEGTYTSLSDLYLFEAGADTDERPPDTREVSNYVRALEHGVARLEELPVCVRMMSEVHRIVLAHVRRFRGGHIMAGQIRTDQNRIGGSSLATARFVPPPPQMVPNLMGDLEKYIQRDAATALPPLVDLALVHYQFETIHPFPDGNGRVGRLLIPLILCEKGVLTQPLLYMSPYFERQKDRYVDLLLEVSRSGAWLDWVRFFLAGVIETADEAIDTVRRLQDLHADYRTRLHADSLSARAVQLIEFLFDEPFVTVRRVQQVLGVATYRGAKHNVDKLVEAGILREVPRSRRPRIYVAHEVFAIIQGRDR